MRASSPPAAASVKVIATNFEGSIPLAIIMATRAAIKDVAGTGGCLDQNVRRESVTARLRASRSGTVTGYSTACSAGHLPVRIRARSGRQADRLHYAMPR
jgi:hypothetical protein